MIDFNTFITMDDNHIIDFNKDEFQSTVYNTQSLEVITVESQLKLIEADARHNDEKFYFGHNGKDSILVFDESMSKIKSISFEFESNENIIRLFGASTNASGQTQFYFRVSEIESIFSDALYNKLIDETGSTLEEFDSGFSFYKFEQNLQVLAFGQQGILKYNIQNDEFKTISFPISGFATTFQSGKYSIAKYATISGLLEFFDSDFEISNLAEIESNLDLRLDYFFDDEGNEYLWYSPFSGSSNYSSIYKNNINLQRIENSSEIISSKLQNLPLKLLSIGPFGTEITEVYSMLPTGTHDLDESIFSLSPNPVSNELRISSDQEFESYIIFDNTAKVVQRKSIFVNDFNIDVSQLNPGIYFLRLQSTDNQTEAKKFIKIK